MKLNDVGFSLHGFFVAMIFVCQCIAYERGQQRVSGFCKFILFGVFLILGWLIYNFSISTLPGLDFFLLFFQKHYKKQKFWQFATEIAVFNQPKTCIKNVNDNQIYLEKLTYR